MKKSYAKKLLSILIIRQNLIIDLTKKIGMKKKEASEIVDFALQLNEKFPNPDEIFREKDKKAFAKLFGEYLRVEHVLCTLYLPVLVLKSQASVVP